MNNQVYVEIEIEADKIQYYSSVRIKQQFNTHHQFEIRIKYDLIEKTGSLSLDKAKTMIGKMAIIKLKAAEDSEDANEFRGLICEITVEKSDNFTSDLLIKGYSPTIILESGPHFDSYEQKNIATIVQEILQKSIESSNCRFNISAKYSSVIDYKCQYKESNFNFINRLSSDYGEWFYYDGKDIFFGKPSSPPSFEITYGEDLHDMQLTLRIAPMSFSNFTYDFKNDTISNIKAQSSVTGLDPYANFVLGESNKIFSEAVSFPFSQTESGADDLNGFVKNDKAAMAADLEVLTGISDNCTISIGSVVTIKLSIFEDSSFKKEDYGKFLITGIEHHVSANGKYYNTFEAIPEGVEVIPVKNYTIPVAEPQVARVKDNADPEKQGRVRVEMIWQQPNNYLTDWIWVMTPDAGSDNRGFVFIPEVGDLVIVNFRNNNPDRPFVMGSLFNAKTGKGGGDKNNTKTVKTKSGVVITIDDDKGSITILDKDKSKIFLDGEGKMEVLCNKSITVTSHDCINIKADKDITFEGNNISLKANAGVEIKGNSKISAESSGTLELKGATASLKGDGQLELQGGGTASLKAAMVQIN